MTFMDELLKEREEQELQERLEMSHLKADQLLMAISVLEDKMNDVNKLANDEISIIEHYRQTEIQKLEKKISWLRWNLDQFMRSTNEKTINLPHGVLKLRLGRDKVDIVDMTKFMQTASKRGLLKQLPESYEPDLRKVQEYIKRGGIVPEGVVFIPAKNKFSYTTNKGVKNNGNGKAEPAETGIEVGPESQASAVEG